jgi:endonuclease G, mitochondrial
MKSRHFALLALTCFAAAFSPVLAAEDDWQPGTANDPGTCRELWEAIGLPRYRPEAEADTRIVCHTRYILSHNNDAKTPDWVIERIPRDQVGGSNKRPKVKFRPEENIPPAARAIDADYTKSGFDRGHQAPSEDFNEDADWMTESFILSNVVPQVGLGFNRGIWAQLEQNVRKLLDDRDELYVITGPIPQDRDGRTLTITTSANACGNEIKLPPLKKKEVCEANNQDAKAKCDAGVAVPAALYKIIFDPKATRANAYVMPNMDHRDTARGMDALSYLKQFRTTVKVVEDQTGLQFFLALPARTRRQQVEQCVASMLH